MEWVPLSFYEDGMNLNDRPRKLTDEELIYITSHMPLAPSADHEAAELNRQCVIEWMIETLKEIQICPSGIPDLIRDIMYQHNKSLAVPGTPIGINAAEALGASSTQMTLNSVAPWERIVIQDLQGNGEVVEIGKWIDDLLENNQSKIHHIPENRTEYLELDQIRNIATCDENGKTSWENITAVTRHLPVGDLVKIKTRSGREVTVTRQKSLLTWNHATKKLQETDGERVQPGDLIPILCEIPNPPIVYETINLRKYLSPKEWLYGSELFKLYNDYNNYDVPGKKRFWTITDRLQNLPHNRADAALRCCRDAIEKGKVQDGFIYPKFYGGAIRTKIPETIVLDKQFGQIVGLYLAEGWATNTFVGISNNAPEIRKLVYDWCDRVGVTYHTVTTVSDRGTSNDIKIHSVLFARWFKKWLNTGSAEKVVPPEILFGNREFIIGVLDGYFAGDGTVCKYTGALRISSVSKALIDGFAYLCNRLGFFGKFSGRQQTHNNIGSKNIKYTYTYSVRNYNADRWAELIGSCHDEKNRKMKIKYARNAEWGMNYIKHENIMLDPIVTVEFVPPTQYVYDLTVPITTNFSLENSVCIRDTFHTSGSSKSASAGIDAMKDLIFARKSPKNESSTIYFTDKSLTYEEVLNTRRYIVGSVINDFVKDYDIDHPDNLKRYWWHDNSQLLLGKQLPPATKVLRLFLNIAEMYKHKVTIADISTVLEREIPPSITTIYGPMADAIIDIYPHPDVIIESMKERQRKVACNTITAEPEKKQKKNFDKIGSVIPELAEMTFLESIVLQELSCIRVKGISGIRGLYPIVSPVWRMVILEKKAEEKHNLPPNSWFLFYNPDIMKRTGLKKENLAALCQLAGLTIVGGTDDRLVVTLPNDAYRSENGEVLIKIDDEYYLELKDVLELEGVTYRETNVEKGATKINDKLYVPIEVFNINGIKYEKITKDISYMKPSEYVNDKVKTDKSRVNNETKRLNDEKFKQAQLLEGKAKEDFLKKPIIVPKTELIKASEFVIAETDGSNLKELLALPGIDKQRTTCNNMYVITATLGAEAALSFLVEAISNTLSNAGLYIHPANIMFIAEFIMNRGEPYGATYSGISRQPAGHLSLATVEKAGKVFIQNALNGRKEDIRNTSASVAVGARISVGDGYFDIAQDIVENGQKVTIINDDLFNALERDDKTIEYRNKLHDERNAISGDDLSSAIADLSSMAAGDVMLDFAPGEDANLLNLFNPNEQINLPQKQELKRTIKKIEVPEELVDTISQIKTGAPLPTLTNIPINVKPAQPIESKGLIPLEELFPPKECDVPPCDIPVGLMDLLNRFDEAMGITVVKPLPEVTIPVLPSLSNFGSAALELRREQTRELQAIDTSTLLPFLQSQSQS